MKNSSDRVIISEHVLEVRHHATGRFLDVRGFVADHIRNADLFPHWEIDTNVVKFRDHEKKAKRDGAFAGYRSAGYYVYDPGTRNYFEDKAGKFWRTLAKNQHYQLPELTRFGCRVKAFLNSDKTFEEINQSIYERFFTDELRNLVGLKEKDLQIVLELEGKQFETRVVCGPLHREEASRHFNFESEHFSDAGIFIDLDVHSDKDIQKNNVPGLIKNAMSIIWESIDKISNSVGV